MNVASFHRTLDQELIAIFRGASLECPVCGEFLLHRADGIGCALCGLELPGGPALGASTVDAETLAGAPSL